MGQLAKAFKERPQGVLPSNTIPNPQKDIKLITIQSGITLAGLLVPPPNPSSKEVEQDPKTTMDQVHISSPESTARVPSSVIQPTPASKPNEIPERDPHQPPIPYPSSELEECMALADLANRSVAYPSGIAEDVFVQVGKFMFPADFVVIDYDVDPGVHLILGRPFLRTTRALVDVHSEELTLSVGDEKLIFNVKSTSKYPHKHGDESIHQIDIIDTTCEAIFMKC
ncbi:reverse transcriptase domain-containing protein [Tanacetum coccineum]